MLELENLRISDEFATINKMESGVGMGYIWESPEEWGEESSWKLVRVHPLPQC